MPIVKFFYGTNTHAAQQMRGDDDGDGGGRRVYRIGLRCVLMKFAIEQVCRSTMTWRLRTFVQMHLLTKTCFSSSATPEACDHHG
ncbi:unnamed protein product [Strongylus vulgaris]|uniref:Uncharacterized protein n=1 Tax=Strongylus vulgaris TaxID=40348 RepID=A0A3P7IUC2_STRVU|nr:unnamed protein product [Strongylus vulgaris]